MKQWKSLILMMALVSLPLACAQGDQPVDIDTGNPSQNTPNVPDDSATPTASPEPSPTPDGGDHDFPPIYSADDPRFQPCIIGTPGCGDLHPTLADPDQMAHQ